MQQEPSWLGVAGILGDLWWTEDKLGTVGMATLTEHNRALIAAFRKGQEWEREHNRK
jgi:hypothetical protein